MIINNENKQILYNYIEKNKELAFDIESEGLNPFTNKVLCMMFGEQDNEFFIPANVELNPKLLDNKIIIGHNIKFDISMTMCHTNKKINNLFEYNNTEFYCTMLASQVIDNGLPLKHSLDVVIERYLGVTIKKDVRESFIGKTDYNFSEEQINYGINDIKYLPLLKEAQLPKIKEAKLHQIIKLENTLIPILADMELEGCKIDVKRLLELSEEYKVLFDKSIFDLDKELYNLPNFLYPELKGTIFVRKRNIYEVQPQISLFNFNNKTIKEVKKEKLIANSKNKSNVNFNSSHKLGKLFKYLNLELPKNNNGATGFGEEHINNYLTENPSSPMSNFLNKLLDMREYNGLITKYGPNSEFINKIHEGRIHTTYTQCLTDTGRLSSQNPNLQNIPNKGVGKKIRTAFIAPENYSLITMDMGGQESRIAGDYSGEPLILNTFLNDGDMHSDLSTLAYSIIFNQDVTIINNDDTLTIQSVKTREKKAIPIYSDNISKEGAWLDIFETNQISYDMVDQEPIYYTYSMKELRDINKNALFGKFYGAGVGRIYVVYSKYINQHYEGNDRVVIAERISKALDERLPILRKYLLKRVDEARKNGYVVTSILGRRRYFQNPENVYGDAMNAPIQGSGAESIKLAMIKIYNYCQLQASKLGISQKEFGYPIMNVHDEIIVCINDKYLNHEIPLRNIVASCLEFFLKTLKGKSSSHVSKYWEK